MSSQCSDFCLKSCTSHGITMMMMLVRFKKLMSKYIFQSIKTLDNTLPPINVNVFWLLYCVGSLVRTFLVPKEYSLAAEKTNINQPRKAKFCDCKALEQARATSVWLSFAAAFLHCMASSENMKAITSAAIENLLSRSDKAKIVYECDVCLPSAHGVKESCRQCFKPWQL